MEGKPGEIKTALQEFDEQKARLDTKEKAIEAKEVALDEKEQALQELSLQAGDARQAGLDTV